MTDRLDAISGFDPRPKRIKEQGDDKCRGRSRQRERDTSDQSFGQAWHWRHGLAGVERTLAVVAIAHMGGDLPHVALRILHHAAAVTLNAKMTNEKASQRLRRFKKCNSARPRKSAARIGH